MTSMTKVLKLKVNPFNSLSNFVSWNIIMILIFNTEDGDNV